MKQRKIALSLAVVGAVAAPFMFGTWKLRPTSTGWEPFMAEEKEKISTYMKHTKNCQTLDENKENDFAWYCRIQLDELNEGGAVKSYFSAPKYLAANAAAAIVGFLGVFALAFTIPALFRRYWRWLNT